MARGSTFTTFFNTQVDTTGAQKLQQLADTAVASYARIQDAATRAAAAANLVGGSGSGGLNISSQLNSQAQAAAALARSNDVASSSQTRFNSTVNAAVQSNIALSRSLSTVATGLSVVQGPLGPIAGRVRALSAALTELTGFRLGLAGIGAALLAFGRIGSEYQNLASRLRPFYDSQKDANAALADIAGIAERSRSSLEPVANLYLRLTQLAKDLPKGTNISGLTETISKASTLSGGSADNQAEGIRQLVQGLGRGILNGQDLRALEEDSYNLSKTIADGLGVNVGQLKQLGAQGKLTTDVVVEALEREQFVIAGRFAQLPVTITSASQQFKNALVTTVGGLDQATGFTNSLAAALSAVATHMRDVVALGLGLGAAFAVPRGINGLSSAIDGVTTKIATAIERQNQLRAATKEFQGFDVYGPSLAQKVPENQAIFAARTNLATAQQGLNAVDTDATGALAAARAQKLADLKSQLVATIDLRDAAVIESDAEIAGLEAEIALRKQNIAALVEQKAEQEANLIAYQRAAQLTQLNLGSAQSEAAGRDQAAAAAQAAQDLQVAEVQLSKTRLQLQNETGAAVDAENALSSARVNGAQRISSAEAAVSAATLKTSIATTEATTANAANVASLEAKAVAEGEVTAATEALEVAQGKGKIASTAFGAALEAIGTSLFSLPTAIFAVTAALAIYASSTSAVDDALSLLNETQRQSIERNNDSANSLLNLGQAGYVAAQGIAAAKVAQAQADFDSQKKAVASSVVGRRFGFGSTQSQLADIADQIRNAPDAQTVAALYAKADQIAPTAQRANSNISDSVFGLLGTTSSQRGAQALADLNTTQQALNLLKQAQSTLPQQFQDALKQTNLLANGGGKTRADIEADAAVQAGGGTAAAREAALHRANLRKIQDQYFSDDDGTGGGANKQYDPATAKAAQDAIAAEDERNRKATAAITAARQGATRDAQVEKQNRLGAIDDQELNALIDLEKRRSTLSVDEYNTEKEAIKAKYDAEKAAIDATGSRSHQMRQQELADITKNNEAAAAAAKAGDALVAKYGATTARPDAEYQRSISDLLAKVNAVGGDQRAGAIQNAIGDLQQVIAPAQRAVQDYVDELGTANVVLGLQAKGWDVVATSVQKALDIQRTKGAVSQADLDAIVKATAEQEQLNIKLQAQENITKNIKGLVDSSQQAFTTLLQNLNPKGFADFFKTEISNVRNVVAQNISESVFAPIKESVSKAFNGNSLQTQQERAQQAFIEAVNQTKGGADTLDTSFHGLSTSADAASDALKQLAAMAAGGGAPGGLPGVGSNAPGVRDSSGDLIGNPNALSANLSSAIKLGAIDFSSSGGGGSSGVNAAGEIVVNANKQTDTLGSGQINNTLSAIGVGLVNPLEKAITSLGGVFGKTGTQIAGDVNHGLTALGKNFGNILGGAGLGLAAGGLLFGSKQSSAGKVGDAIGGAIGNVAGKALGKLVPEAASGLLKSLGSAAGPIGSVVGSVLGGLLGGLFAKTPHGASTITTSSTGTLQASAGFGNSAKAEAAAVGEANSVISGINQVAQTLGAQISGSPNVTVGTYKGKYRVNTQGTKLGGSSSPVAGLTDFGDDEAAAVQYAIVASIQNGVIKGISQASINILKSGQDLNTALQKALTIENIPKQLEQLTNPVKYAVDTLNTQFQTVIADLKEGGATAEQYAQASQLYDLERAQAISDAAKTAFGSIEDYLKQLTGGSDSPFNKETTYQNAKSVFAGFQSQIDAGKAVDPTELQNAAENFRTASNSLYGSSSDFFTDFNTIVTELQKADATATNAVNTSTSQTLPASPFSTDSTVQAALGTLNKTTQDASTASTNAIVDAINKQTDALKTLGAGSILSGGPAIALLAGNRK